MYVGHGVVWSTYQSSQFFSQPVELCGVWGHNRYFPAFFFWWSFAFLVTSLGSYKSPFPVLRLGQRRVDGEWLRRLVFVFLSDQNSMKPTSWPTTNSFQIHWDYLWPWNTQIYSSPEDVCLPTSFNPRSYSLFMNVWEEISYHKWSADTNDSEAEL